MVNSDLQPVALIMKDGTISIMYIVTAEYDQTSAEAKMIRVVVNDQTVKEELAKWADKGKDVVSWRFITAEDVPLDRTYRAAWRDNGKEIHHDMEHARQLHLDMIRDARTAELGKLDREWMKAMGQGNATMAADVEAKRQALRDLPTTLPLADAKTTEDLYRLWPDGLARS